MNVMNIRYIIVAVILMVCGLASAGNERASGYHFKTVDRHFDSIAARAPMMNSTASIPRKPSPTLRN